MPDVAEKRELRQGYHTIGFAFPEEVTESVKRLARQHNRSLVGEIVTALQEHIARYAEQASKQGS